MSDEQPSAGMWFGADGEVEIGREVSLELVGKLSRWADANPKLAVVAAVACYPAYARLAAAKHRRVRIMTLVGMAVDYIGDQIYERMRQDYGPTDDEEIADAWGQKAAGCDPN